MADVNQRTLTITVREHFAFGACRFCMGVGSYLRKEQRFHFRSHAVPILGSITGPEAAGTASSGLRPFWSHSKWALPLPKHHEVTGRFSPGVKDKTDAVISCFFPPAPTLLAVVLVLTMECFLN